MPRDPKRAERKHWHLLSEADTFSMQQTALEPLEKPKEHLAGPVVDPEKTPDVVTSQSQVDDLLASLGF